MEAAAIARLSIVLDGVLPRLRRRLDVPLSATLTELHTILQAAIGWDDRHIYLFRFGETCFGHPHPNRNEDVRPAQKIWLGEALHPAVARFTYLYDFGDNWRHSIDVEAIAPRMQGQFYPCLVDASGRCPPENVGGADGYAAFLDAMQDPAHPEHSYYRAWHGSLFDPDEVDVPRIRRTLAHLARQLIAPHQPRRAPQS